MAERIKSHIQINLMGHQLMWSLGIIIVQAYCFWIGQLKWLKAKLIIQGIGKTVVNTFGIQIFKIKLERKKVKTENKIYWLILSSLLALCLSILVPTFFMVRYELMELIRDRLIANATAAALAYDGDVLETITIKNQSERIQEIQTIQKINTRLENIHPDIKFAYVMTKDELGSITFLVDSITIDRNNDGVINENEKSAEMGEVYKNPTNEMKEGFLHPSADKEINYDRWGEFLSGYAPIYNSKNEAVAIVGLDMQASTVQNKMYIFYLTSIFAIGFAILLSLFLSGWLRKTLLKLTRSE